MSDFVNTDLLREMDPNALEAFVAHLGWVKNRETDIASQWAGGGLEILIPRDRSFDDYLLRLSEALRQIAETLDRPIEAVATEVLAWESDIIRFECRLPTSAEGSIPFHAGLSLFDGVKACLTAAAKASVSPQPYFGKRSRQVARRYLQNVRLGQTMKGSFVVTVISALDAPTERSQSQLAVAVPPFTRQVALTLFQALGAAKEAAGTFLRTQDAGVFDASVPKGVSSDLCESLLLMIDDPEPHELRVVATWSDLLVESSPGLREVLFTPDEVGPLEMARYRLRAQEADRGFRLNGPVLRLARSTAQGPGVATIRPMDFDRAGQVRIRLEGEAYNVAIEAHRAGQHLAAVGDLTRDGNTYWLYNSTQVRMVEIGGRFRT